MSVTYLEKLAGLKRDGYLVHCDEPNCFLNVATYTLEAATGLDTNHKCPHAGGATHFSWETTMTIVEQMWTKIDREYQNLLNMRAAGHDDKDTFIPTQKSRLRGMAEMIALYMTPHFHDADEITREVVHRKKMRDAGEPYETPGLGSRIYEMPRYEPSDAHKATQTKRESVVELAQRGVPVQHGHVKAKPAAGVRITADLETQAAIRGLAGLAEPHEIAQIYGVQTDVVKAILAKSD